MRSVVSPMLRLLGPMIELVCISLLFQARGRGIRVLGLDAETWLYGGIGLGVVFVILGLLLARRGARPKDRWDAPRGV